MFLNILAVVFRLGILIICARLVKQGSFTIISTVVIFSIASGVINLLKVMYIGHFIKLQLLSLFRDIRTYLLFMLIVAGSYVLIKQIFNLSDLLIFFTGALLGGVYYAVLLFTQPALKKLILSFISKRKNKHE